MSPFSRTPTATRCTADWCAPQCNLHELGGEDAYLAEVRAWADGHPDLEWITGDGWTYGQFAGGMPHRSALDRVVPDRPVFLTAFDGHTAWVNSRALELAGISRDTPDPGHGRCVRDPDGTPTGALVEDAVGSVGRLVPDPSHETLVQALRDSERHSTPGGSPPGTTRA